MTVAGVKSARPRGRTGGSGGRSAPPVVVARVTLAAPPPPPPAEAFVGAVQDPKALARRSDLHAARRLRRRDSLLGLGMLAATFGATVAVLDVFH